MSLGIKGWRRVGLGLGYIRWKELDLDPTAPPGSDI